MNIIAGIVTFNPNIHKFKENIVELSKQVNQIIIIDNNSNNINLIIKICGEIENKNTKIDIIRNAYNYGVAAALSTLMEQAEIKGVDWVLSLDQDSVITDGLLYRYEQCLSDNKNQNIAIMTCKIVDRNFKQNEENSIRKYTRVDSCITSGSLTNVKLYKEVKGYDKHFFIDLVDFDLCCQFRELGYEIIKVNEVGLIHEVGNGKNVVFFGKRIAIYNESAERNFYSGRNLILMHWKHRKQYTISFVFLHILKKLIRIGLYEQNKLTKLSKYFSGIKRGIQERNMYKQC